jgi:hypothetical protein
MPHPAPEPRELSVIHSVLELIRMQLDGFMHSLMGALGVKYLPSIYYVG